MSGVTDFDHIALALCHEINAHCGGCTCRKAYVRPCAAMIDQARRFMVTIGMTESKVKTLAHKRDVQPEVF